MKRVLPLILFALLPACGPSQKSPNLGGIYNAAAKQEHLGGNPIIVIPGILGSRLVDDQGRVVWGQIGGSAVDPSSADGRRLLALPISATDWPRDNIKADGALEQLKLSIGFDFQFTAYAGMLQAFGVGGYLDSAKIDLSSVDYGPGHYNCFQFGYDWRRSCAENAAELGRFIEDKRRYVQSERIKQHGRSGEVKFDIIAHSMGGLVARYYLMYGKQPLRHEATMPVTWAGAQHVDKLIMVGTPNDGSINVVQQLSSGYRIAPFLPKMDAAVVATMPSLYELLPHPQAHAVIDEHSRPIALETLSAWETLRWGLADPDQDEVLQDLLPDLSSASERRAAALAHLSKLLRNAQAFHRAMEAPCNPPPGVEIHAFAGDAVATGSRAQINSKGKPEIIDWIPGDGSVTRRSMLLDRRTAAEAGERLKSPIRWTDTRFVFSDHIGMTRDPAFVDNVLHILLERP
jgi:pimeloyl-ACP methyl ester carboxylesterase